MRREVLVPHRAADVRWRRLGGHRVGLVGVRLVAVEHPSSERACNLLAGIDLYGAFNGFDVARVTKRSDAPPGAPSELWLIGKCPALEVDGERHAFGRALLLCGDGRERLWICGRVRGALRGGPLTAVEYISNKWDRKRRHYKHDFEAPFPRLEVDGSGYLRIAGGRYQLTADGIAG